MMKSYNSECRDPRKVIAIFEIVEPDEKTFPIDWCGFLSGTPPEYYSIGLLNRKVLKRWNNSVLFTSKEPAVYPIIKVKDMFNPIIVSAGNLETSDFIWINSFQIEDGINSLRIDNPLKLNFWYFARAAVYDCKKAHLPYTEEDLIRIATKSYIENGYDCDPYPEESDDKRLLIQYYITHILGSRT